LESFQPQSDFYVTPNIPGKKLANARIACNVPQDEQILALIDCTVFGSAKDCILFGSKSIYYHEMLEAPGNILYANFPDCNFTIKTDYILLVSNGQRLNLSGSDVRTPTLHKVLDEIKSLFP